MLITRPKLPRELSLEDPKTWVLTQLQALLAIWPYTWNSCSEPQFTRLLDGANSPTLQDSCKGSWPWPHLPWDTFKSHSLHF